MFLIEVFLRWDSLIQAGVVVILGLAACFLVASVWETLIFGIVRILRGHPAPEPPGPPDPPEVMVIRELREMMNDATSNATSMDAAEYGELFRSMTETVRSAFTHVVYYDKDQAKELASELAKQQSATIHPFPQGRAGDQKDNPGRR